MATYFNMFLKDVYPGSKRSPVELAKMMATPEINPDVKMSGKDEKAS